MDHLARWVRGSKGARSTGGGGGGRPSAREVLGQLWGREWGGGGGGVGSETDGSKHPRFVARKYGTGRWVTRCVIYCAREGTGFGQEGAGESLSRSTMACLPALCLLQVLKLQADHLCEKGRVEGPERRKQTRACVTYLKLPVPQVREEGQNRLHHGQLCVVHRRFVWRRVSPRRPVSVSVTVVVVRLGRGLVLVLVLGMVVSVMHVGPVVRRVAATPLLALLLLLLLRSTVVLLAFTVLRWGRLSSPAFGGVG